jgi:hypothetical protein
MHLPAIKLWRRLHGRRNPSTSVMVTILTPLLLSVSREDMPPWTPVRSLQLAPAPARVELNAYPRSRTRRE